jgi:hypothetical protein
MCAKTAVAVVVLSVLAGDDLHTRPACEPAVYLAYVTCPIGSITFITCVAAFFIDFAGA